MLLVCGLLPSHDMLKAFRPIDFSSEQICFPLLEMQTNEGDDVLFAYFSNAYWRFLIILSSNWIKYTNTILDYV